MIDNNSKMLLDQLQGFAWTKDLNGRFTYANPFFLALHGYASFAEVEGIRDQDLTSPVFALAEAFVRQDQLVINTQQSINLIAGSRLPCTNKFVVIMGQKTVIRDNENNIIGTMGIGFDITNNSALVNTILLFNTSMNEDIDGLQPFCYLITDTYANIKTTPREAECLFYLLRGKSAKAIASRLNCSAKTVEYHIANLKYKAGCDSKAQLIEKALSEGAFNILPSSIFSQ